VLLDWDNGNGKDNDDTFLYCDRYRLFISRRSKSIITIVDYFGDNSTGKQRENYRYHS
jgi:hypothetical protein